MMIFSSTRKIDFGIPIDTIEGLKQAELSLTRSYDEKKFMIRCSSPFFPSRALNQIPTIITDAQLLPTTWQRSCSSIGMLRQKNNINLRSDRGRAIYSDQASLHKRWTGSRTIYFTVDRTRSKIYNTQDLCYENIPLAKPTGILVIETWRF